MKVAFDHHIFAINRYGGASRYLFELASRLPAHGVRDVCVVAPLYINNYLAVDAGRRLTRGRYVSNRFGDWWIGLRQPVSVVDVIDRVAAPLAWRGVKPDIIHETWHTRKPVGRARRRVVTAYDLTHELFPDEFAPALIRNWIAAKRAAIKRADHIICISENTRRDLVRLYDIDPNSTSVVHLGYSTSVEAKATTTAPSNHRPFLLCVGNRAGQKNFKMLLQAYS
ncbi:glycosyltransferase, partial [Mycobacterium colombiense]